MNFNKHSDFVGLHAFLSPSKHYWIGYTEDKICESYKNSQAIQRGIALHEFAKDAILLRRKQPKTKDALNQYVNDAIGYRMTPEQPLVYSVHCFGTADTISFRERFLRIHDLKTGVSPVHMAQLKIYTALFCLEYEENPKDIAIELRIYQGAQDPLRESPDPEEIEDIMKKIRVFDKLIENMKLEEQYV